MPSFHEYQSYRLDLSSIEDRTAADRLTADVETIMAESDGGDEWLTKQLETLATKSGALVLDLLVFERDYTAWSLWGLERGEVSATSVGLRRRGEIRLLTIDDDWVRPELALPSPEVLGQIERQLEPLLPSRQELSADERTLIFPYEWSTEQSLVAGLELLRPYLAHVPKLALVEITEARGGLHLVRLSDLARPTDVAALEPWIEDPIRRARLERLWYEGTEVLHQTNH